MGPTGLRRAASLMPSASCAVQPSISSTERPSSTTTAARGATMRMKSKLYLSGVKNTYELRNCSIGGTMIRLGSPPGKPVGTFASCWLGETLLSITGESLLSVK